MLEPRKIWDWYQQRSKWLKPFLIAFILVVGLAIIVIKYFLPKDDKNDSGINDPVVSAVDGAEKHFDAHLERTERQDAAMQELLEKEKKKRAELAEQKERAMEDNRDEQDKIDSTDNDAAAVVELLKRNRE